MFADSHGNCVHLFERDCSVQRRHQKVLEEAPAPGLTRRTAAGDGRGGGGGGARGRLCRRRHGGIHLPTRTARFYFMEMNTRLQVEHPVTEMITGLDLVEWQLRVAAGEPLPLRQDELRSSGHAIEVRLYAEDPRSGFLPPIGRLRASAPARAETRHVRIDTGVGAGDTITLFYDPMIAKLIVLGRSTAPRRWRRLRDGAGAIRRSSGRSPTSNSSHASLRIRPSPAADLTPASSSGISTNLLPEPAPAGDDVLPVAATRRAAGRGSQARARGRCVRRSDIAMGHAPTAGA